VEARFSTPVQTGHGAHPTSCTMGTGSFPVVKSGRGVTLTPHPFWCRGHERVELYLYSPYGPYGLYSASVPVQGCTLPYGLYRASVPVQRCTLPYGLYRAYVSVQRCTLPYGLYRASVPVKGCTLPYGLYKGDLYLYLFLYKSKVFTENLTSLVDGQIRLFFPVY
jgi:hypothetical protein